MRRSDLESLYRESLPAIDRVVAALASRNSLTPDASAKFAAWVKARIVENDYKVLAKFRNQSSVQVYLAVVIANLFREYRVLRLKD